MSEEDYWTEPEGLQVRIEMLSHDAVWGAYNQASYESFKYYEARQIEWVTEIDDRTCDYCDSQSGRRYYLGQFLPWLPNHPSCRCWWDVIT